jgi:hypothetical protein
MLTWPSLQTIDQKFPPILALCVLAICAARILWRVVGRMRAPPVDSGANIFDAPLPEIGERMREKLERIICSGKGYLVPVIWLPCAYIGAVWLMPLFEAHGLRNQDGFAVSMLIAAVVCAWIGWNDGAAVRVPDAKLGGTKAGVLRHVFLGFSMPKWAMIFSALGLVGLHDAREKMPTLPTTTVRQATPTK